MRKALLAAGGMIAALCASQAGAQTITFQNGGNTLLPQEELVNTFANSGGPTALVGGTNAFTYSGNVPGTAVLPLNAPANGSPNDGFAAVLGGGSYTYTLQYAAQVLSFLIGGIDATNSITLNFLGGGSQTLTGAAIVGGNVATNGSVSGRVRYDRGGAASIASVTFASGSNSLEFDDIAIAAPEPATWAMMIFGFGMVGAGMRRRRRSTVLARA